MHNPKNLNLTIASTLSLMLAFTATAKAEDFNQAIENALKFGQDDAKYGQIKFDLRFRYDNTDSLNPKEKVGNAFTGRLRLGYLTPVYEDFQGYAEFEGNQDIIVNSYNSSRNGKTQYERISDPQQNNLNQLWISYKGIPDTEIKIGRQRMVNFDNERFMGAAGWRQLDRTFDGLQITNTSLPNTTIKAAYLIKQLNTDATVHSMQFPLLHIAYVIPEIGTLSSYGFWFDDRDQRPQDSNQTYGVRFDGSRKIIEDLSLVYTAEYAHQSNFAGNPTPYQTDYYHIIGGVTLFGVTVKAGMEELDGKGYNKTFDTPFGLLNRFNGWADLFLVTPDNGLRDVYASVETTLMDIKFIGAYHDFSDDSSRQHYGNELNFGLTKEFFKHYTLLARYAVNPHTSNGMRIVGGSSPIELYDRQKIWFSVSASF